MNDRPIAKESTRLEMPQTNARKAKVQLHGNSNGNGECKAVIPNFNA